MVRANSFKDVLERPLGQNDENMIPKFLRWFGCLAMALDHIHGLGIRHRDIKPDNILVTNDDEIVLADFGISNMILGKTLATTSPGAARERTVMYCAPEVEDGSSRTRSADIFALGVVFLQMLAKLRPGGASDLESALAGDNSDSEDDSNQHQSYARALPSIHALMDNDWSEPKGPVWKGRVKEWRRLLTVCKNMTSEDPYRRQRAPDIVSKISGINRGTLMQPCKCSQQPEEARAQLLYVCKHGLTGDVRLPRRLMDLKQTVGAIHQASARGHLTIVKTLLAKGFDAKLCDHSGQTALHCAAAFGKYRVVEHLLSIRVEANSQDNKGRTALHYAAGNGSLEAVEKLLGSPQGGLVANSVDEHRRTALHFAATRGHSQIIGKLIASEAREYVIDAEDKNGITALHLAAGYGSLQAVQLLLVTNHANPDVLDKKERAVLHFAIDGIQKLDKVQDRGQYDAVIELLLPETHLDICIRVACGNARIKPCNHPNSRRNMVCKYVAEQPSQSTIPRGALTSN